MLVSKDKFNELLESINGLIELSETEILIMRTNPQYCYDVLNENFGANKALYVTEYLFEIAFKPSFIKQLYKEKDDLIKAGKMKEDQWDDLYKLPEGSEILQSKETDKYDPNKDQFVKSGKGYRQVLGVNDKSGILKTSHPDRRYFKFDNSKLSSNVDNLLTNNANIAWESIKDDPKISGVSKEDFINAYKTNQPILRDKNNPSSAIKVGQLIKKNKDLLQQHSTDMKNILNKKNQRVVMSKNVYDIARKGYQPGSDNCQTFGPDNVVCGINPNVKPKMPITKDEFIEKFNYLKDKMELSYRDRKDAKKLINKYKQIPRQNVKVPPEIMEYVRKYKERPETDNPKLKKIIDIIYKDRRDFRSMDDINKVISGAVPNTLINYVVDEDDLNINNPRTVFDTNPLINSEDKSDKIYKVSMTYGDTTNNEPENKIQDYLDKNINKDLKSGIYKSINNNDFYDDENQKLPILNINNKLYNFTLDDKEFNKLRKHLNEHPEDAKIVEQLRKKFSTSDYATDILVFTPEAIELTKKYPNLDLYHYLAFSKNPDTREDLIDLYDKNQDIDLQKLVDIAYSSDTNKMIKIYNHDKEIPTTIFNTISKIPNYHDIDTFYNLYEDNKDINPEVFNSFNTSDKNIFNKQIEIYNKVKNNISDDKLKILLKSNEIKEMYEIYKANPEIDNKIFKVLSFSKKPHESYKILKEDPEINDDALHAISVSDDPHNAYELYKQIPGMNKSYFKTIINSANPEGMVKLYKNDPEIPHEVFNKISNSSYPDIAYTLNKYGYDDNLVQTSNALGDTKNPLFALRLFLKYPKISLYNISRFINNNVSKYLDKLKRNNIEENLMLANKEKFIELLESINGLIELSESEILTMRTNPEFCYEILQENFGTEKAELFIDYLFESNLSHDDSIALAGRFVPDSKRDLTNDTPEIRRQQITSGIKDWRKKGIPIPQQLRKQISNYNQKYKTDQLINNFLYPKQ